MLTQEHILHEWLYEKSYRIAILHHNSDAVIDVALCYGYEREVTNNWDECVMWLAVAAFMDSAMAVPLA